MRQCSCLAKKVNRPAAGAPAQRSSLASSAGEPPRPYSLAQHFLEEVADRRIPRGTPGARLLLKVAGPSSRPPTATNGAAVRRRQVNSQPCPPVPVRAKFLRRHGRVWAAAYVESIAGQVRPFVREYLPAQLSFSGPA